MRRYKIIEYADGHCVVKIKEGIWPFWQTLWNYTIWTRYEERYNNRVCAQSWVDKDQASREVKRVTKHP